MVVHIAQLVFDFSPHKKFVIFIFFTSLSIHFAPPLN